MILQFFPYRSYTIQAYNLNFAQRSQSGVGEVLSSRL